MKEKQGALAGKRVVLTSSLDVSRRLQEPLEALGADVSLLPLIETKRDCNSQTLDDVMSEIAGYEWVVFTSQYGVRYFFELFYQRFRDLRCIGPMRIACVGSSTADAVLAERLEVDLVPEMATAEVLAQELVKTESLDSSRVLVVTGNLNSKELVNHLESEGRAIVDTLQVYKTEPVSLKGMPEAERFCKQGADTILFTSPSAVRSFCDQAGDLQLEAGASHPVAGSMGPVTTQAMEKVGMKPVIEAQNGEHTAQDLVDATVSYFECK